MKYISIVIFIMIAIAIFGFQNNTVGFEISHHGYVSAHGLAISRNFSWQHPFFVYEVKRSDSGIEHYYPYNRFPPTIFALIKLSTVLAGEKLSDQVYVAKQLMNIFFFFTILLSYILVYKLINLRWLSLIVVCFTFSTHYLQLYNDLIFNDIPTLFGCMLLLVAIVDYQQKGRKWFAYIATMVAVAFGWQPLAILVTWHLIEQIQLLLQRKWHIQTVLCLFSFKLLALGTIVAGIIIGFNLYNETLIMKKPPLQAGSLGSILGRLGFSKDIAALPAVAWPQFILEQSYRIVTGTIPSLLLFNWWPPIHQTVGLGWTATIILLIIGIGSCISLFVHNQKEHRKVLLLLVLGIFPWMIGLRYFVAFHDFQAIFYVGITLVFYYAVFSFIAHFLAKYLLPYRPVLQSTLIGLSVILFVSTTIYSNQQEMQNSALGNSYTHDFDRIVNIVGENKRLHLAGNIYPFPMPGSAASFYTSDNLQSDLSSADYVISLNKNYNTHNLTPNNQWVFLFEKQ